MIPRFIWEKFPFDENVTNIEDRIWGKEVIKQDIILFTTQMLRFITIMGFTKTIMLRGPKVLCLSLKK